MKLKYLLLIITIISCFFFLKNLSDKEDFKQVESYNIEGIVYDEINNYHYVSQANSGISLGIVNGNHNKLIENRNFQIKDGETLKKTIAIANQNSYKENFLIIPIIDYKQSSILIHGAFKDKIAIELDSKEIAFIPFTSPILNEGFHDFSFLIVQDPYNKNLSKEHRMSTTGSHLLSIRGTVKVGDVKDESTKLDTNFIEYNTIQEDVKLDGLLLTKGNDLKPWLTQKVNSNNIKFNVNVGNMKNKEQTFVIISFLNWSQIPFNHDNEVIFGEIKGKSLQRIEGEISKSDIEENSISNFTTVFIPYPYTEIDYYSPDFSIEPSTRVGLDNRQN